MRRTPATTAFGRSILGLQWGESKAKSHQKNGLTTGASRSVGRSETPRELPDPASNILEPGPEPRYNFGCYNSAFARLRYSPDSPESWHSIQIGTFLPAGSYLRMCARHFADWSVVIREVPRE